MPNPFKSEFDTLKDLGMTPQEIKDAVAAKKTLEAKQTTMETELTATKASLSTLEGSFNETKNKLNDIEANSRRQAAPTTPTAKTSFLDNEEAAFAERVAEGA